MPNTGNARISLIEAWGAVLGYAPSMLVFAGIAPELWPMLELNLVVPTLAAYVAAGCITAAAPAAIGFEEHRRDAALLSAGTRRTLRVVLLMNWIPHYAAIAVLGVAVGIQHDGLIP